MGLQKVLGQWRRREEERKAAKLKKFVDQRRREKEVRSEKEVRFSDELEQENASEGAAEGNANRSSIVQECIGQWRRQEDARKARSLKKFIHQRRHEKAVQKPEEKERGDDVEETEDEIETPAETVQESSAGIEIDEETPAVVDRAPKQTVVVDRVPHYEERGPPPAAPPRDQKRAKQRMYMDALYTFSKRMIRETSGKPGDESVSNTTSNTTATPVDKFCSPVSSDDARRATTPISGITSSPPPDERPTTTADFFSNLTACTPFSCDPCPLPRNDDEQVPDKIVVEMQEEPPTLAFCKGDDDDGDSLDRILSSYPGKTAKQNGACGPVLEAAVENDSLTGRLRDFGDEVKDKKEKADEIVGA